MKEKKTYISPENIKYLGETFYPICASKDQGTLEDLAEATFFEENF